MVTVKCVTSKGELFYREEGEGQPLLIFHSMGTDHRSMLSWLEPFFQLEEISVRRFYVDLPAHGQTKINSKLTSTDHMVQMIEEFIEQVLPGENVSLLGMSFGGYIAQGLMDRLLDKINGIALLAPAVHNRTNQLPKKIILESNKRILQKMNEDKWNAFSTLMIYENDWSYTCFMNEIQPGRELADRAFSQSDWRKHSYFLSQEPFYNRGPLTNPALLLLGRQDSICGYQDHLPLLETFSNCTCAILDGAGHMLPIDKRNLVQEHVKDWISKL